MPPGDAAGSASRPCRDISGFEAQPESSGQHPWLHLGAMNEQARRTCEDAPREDEAPPPSPYCRSQGQTAAPSKPGGVRPDGDAALAATLSARLATGLDGEAPLHWNEELTKPRATYSPEQLKRLQACPELRRGAAEGGGGAAPVRPGVLS